MSMLNASVDSAIAIAERRSKKLGAGVYSGRSSRIIERSFVALKSSTWFVVFSGFVEPVFYLLSFGYGIGNLIGAVTASDGTEVPYAAFIAPALLATSAMNGAIFDSTWNVFFKMHHSKLYQGMLSTSMGPLDVALGEMGWALLRGLAYAVGFFAIAWPLGLIISPIGILAIPAAVLVAFGFAAIGMGVTSYLRNFQQLNWVNFVLLPMFMFSGTFYPLSVYPEAIQSVIQLLPLWHAVELIRGLTLGVVNLGMLGHVGYFLGMIALGLVFTTIRLRSLFMK
ncbi:MAG: ABC transporter permease [Actinomycetota bacterium]